MILVIELQDPARTATKGVPAGTPLLRCGKYYGSAIVISKNPRSFERGFLEEANGLDAIYF